MLLYSPVKLKCAELIKSVTAEYMAQFSSANVYAKYVPFSNLVHATINEEMGELGLPKINLKPLAFKRRFPENEFNYNNCHIDRGASESTNTYASIVIPVSGCEDTEQYWYDGNYTNNMVIYGDDKVSYFKLVWESEPKLIGKVEILDGPMLCRTDIPHSAYGNGREYRTTCTLRFVGNPSFEEILERFNSAK